MINVVKVNIKNKHDFILINKDDGKWFSQINDRLTCIDKSFSPLNLKPKNNVMKFKK